MTELHFRQSSFSSFSLPSVGILLGEKISLFTLPFPLSFYSSH